jgi:hypothetical protein
VTERIRRVADCDREHGRAVLPVVQVRVERLAPVHLRGVSELFVAQLDEKELAVLKSALDKVTVDCTFG